jgi:hypothetical protein
VTDGAVRLVADGQSRKEKEKIEAYEKYRRTFCAQPDRAAGFRRRAKLGSGQQNLNLTRTRLSSGLRLGLCPSLL